MLPAVSRVRSVLKCALLSGFAVAALTGASTVAQAVTLSGTFGVDIYQGTGNGTSTDSKEQANQANPLITGSPLASGTYTGDINLYEPKVGGTNTIGAFLGSAGGSTSGLAAVSGLTMSTATFALTTVFVFTGSVGPSTLVGNIVHDDGISLYDGPGYSTLLTAAGDAAPTSQQTTGYAGLTGPWQLIYVEANGLAAQLQFNYSLKESSIVPLPASLWLFGSVLAGSGLFFGRRRKRQSAAAA